MSRVDELDPLLQSLQALKPPGASKSKIAAITTICLDNPHSDATIVQKLYSNFKKTPPSHKLGILFVVDSVTRQWIERARAAGQELTPSAPSGTYASGVQRMTELLPSLVDEAIRLAPVDQKSKLQNLVDIWDRSNTFPARMLNDFKSRLNAPIASNVPSRTPPGSPPPQLLYALGLRKPPPQPQMPQVPQQPPPASFPSAPTPVMAQQPQMPSDPTSLLQMLAGLARPSQVTPVPAVPTPAPQPAAPAPVLPPQGVPDLSAFLNGFSLPQAAPQSQPTPASLPQFAFPQQAYNPPVVPQVPGLPPQFAALFAGGLPPAPPVVAPPPKPVIAAPSPSLQSALGPLATMIPPAILANPEQLTQVLQLLGELTKANVPPEQWGPVIEALYPSAAIIQAPVPPTLQPSWQIPNGTINNVYDSRGQQGRDRKRSRSPDNRYDNAQNGARGARYGGQSEDNYRQRSPPAAQYGNQQINGQKSGEKWLSYDPTLPPNHIKVLSRTLFVGGCSASDQELRAIFSQFGAVQSCVTNQDKRHGFVKMCTRAGSVAAKKGMEDLSNRDQNVMAKARQTKWGVGFGPRDCCDYATGESTVPIASLTEADHKWALTAEYGGTGGKDITPGMVMEEPDIEIGAGVSSKAMSRRVGPIGEPGGRGKHYGGGGGGGHGGGAGRHGGGGGGRQGGGQSHGRRQQQRQQHHQQQVQQQHQQQHQQQQQHEPRRDNPKLAPVQEQSTFQPPPPVPNFGFSFPVPGKQ